MIKMEMEKKNVTTANLHICTDDALLYGGLCSLALGQIQTAQHATHD